MSLNVGKLGGLGSSTIERDAPTQEATTRQAQAVMIRSTPITTRIIETGTNFAIEAVIRELFGPAQSLKSSVAQRTRPGLTR